MGEWWVVKCGGYLTTKRELEAHLGERWSYYKVERSKRTSHRHTEEAASRWMREHGSCVWLLKTLLLAGGCHSRKDDLFTGKITIRMVLCAHVNKYCKYEY